LLISLLTGGFGGLLWIGRPWLALGLLVSQVAWLLGLLSGWIVAPYFYLYIFSGLLCSAIGTIIVLALRSRSMPIMWHSKWYWVLGLSFFVYIGTAAGIRSLVYQPFSIPASSMMPNLIPGDHIVANKSVFGYSRSSFPFGLLNFKGRTVGTLPVRGDIIVFKFKNGHIDYVKRVIGLPGETIQLIAGVPYINGQPVKHSAVGNYTSEPDVEQAKLVEETLPEGRRYLVLDAVQDSSGDNTEPFLVPADQYFVLGDHRDNSMDSRYTTGNVALESIVGRVDRIVANEHDAPFADRQPVNAH
jgi:signal peptidase I